MISPERFQPKRPWSGVCLMGNSQASGKSEERGQRAEVSSPRQPWREREVAGGTQSFHLSAQPHHSRSDAFVLFVVPVTVRLTAPWLTRP